MKVIKISIIVAAAMLIPRVAFCAQQNTSEEPIVCNGDRIEYLDGNKKLVGSGNINLSYGDMNIKADKVEVNMETKEAFASGNVVMKQGVNTFKSENVLYNFVEKKGRLVNCIMEAPPWYGKCYQIDKVGDKEYVLGSGYISTCDRIPPHYSIRTKQVKLYLDNKIEAKNVVMYAGSVPILYLPVYTHSMKGVKPNIAVVPGHSKEWGYYNLADFRYSFTEDQQGKIRFDLRSEKGLASGFSHNYALKFLENNVDLGKGIFDVYYTNEDDKTKPKDARHKQERYRVMERHMWDLDEKTYLLAEYNKLKDPDFTKDYFYRQEYVNEIQPDTYLYLTRADSSYSSSFFLRHRVNDFYTETEYQPQFDVNIKNQRLLKELPFYYKGEYNAASLTKKTAYSDIDNEAVRLDGYNEVSGVFTPVKSLSLRPYIATRQTWYSRDKNTDEYLTRGVFYSGIDTSTKFYKTYDWDAEILGAKMNGLRHVVTPIVRYGYTHKPDVLPEELSDFDDLDTINRNNAVTFALENDFQTKRLSKDWKGDLAGKYDTFDFARVVLSTDYDFQRTPGGHFTNILGNLEIIPSHKFLIQSDASFNPRSTKFDIANIDFVARRDDGAKLGIGHRYERRESSELTSDIYYPLTKKLMLHNYERFQFYSGDLKEQEYGLSYDLHCWIMDVNFNKGTNGGAIWVIFKLKAFPEFPIQLGSTYESPKPETVGN